MDTLQAGALAIVRRLRGHGFQAYWVGGSVRDLEMGRVPHDYDIATNAPPATISRLFEAASEVGAQFGVVVVNLGGHHYEVSTFRAEGPYLDGRRPSSVEFVDAEHDVRRRDFTINGLLFDPQTHTTIDYVGGRDDLAQRRVRAIGDPHERFVEDRLRMLRAIRLAAELEFEIDDETFRAIHAEAPAISIVSAERIRGELVRLITAPARRWGLERLEASGLLSVILPEVAAMVGVPQPPEFHPEGDVFAHTALALEHLTALTPVLAMGVLLHDVGKPPTFARTDRIRFNRHDEVGATLTEAICQRLRFSGAETSRIVTLVREHLRIGELTKMRPAKVKRFLLQPDFLDHLELHRADSLACHGDLSAWEWAQQAYHALLAEPPPRQRLLSGDDLIAMGYQPGPAFATMLEFVEDAQLEGRISTREAAQALIQTTFPRSNPPA